MKRPRLQLGLPLLARELADQAAHARHYVLRCLCAIVMFGICFFALRDVLVADQTVGQMSLGRGLVVVESVTTTQAFIIVLFLPAITCGAIAGEKERNTLPILLTTRLGSLTIVLEKLASRLVIVFMLLLLSLPLLAVAYSMGGISLRDLLGRVLYLAELSLLVASLTLMCSAWCGSTVSAFFMSYFVAGALFFSGLIGLGIVYPLIAHFGPPGRWLVHVLTLFAPLLFISIATRCLISRAFVTPRNFILALFRGLDRLYTRMNVVVGNIELVREKALLPGDKPIAWRETAKKSLGTVRYLVRVLVAIELPTVFLLVISSDARSVDLSSGFTVASWLWFVVWCIAATLIAVSAASIVSSERTRQTLPVVLATPMAGDQIVRDLFAGVRRLITVLWIPFATIAAYQYWFHLGAARYGQANVTERLCCALLEVAIYPFLIGWAAFYLGTRVRSALWAVLGSLLAVLIAILLPYAAALLVMWLNLGRDVAVAAAYASPATIVVLNERQGVTPQHVCGAFAAFCLLTLLIRARCLRRADRLLGRTAAPAGRRPHAAPNTRAFALPRAPHRRPDASPQLSETAG
jgi:ABC-type transport system involved in multi-copper enzyme maturation permease subunit